MADCRKSTLIGLAALSVVVTGFACGGEDPVNEPPVPRGLMGPFEVVEGETTTKRVRQFFKDPDGDALTYEAVSADESVATTSVDGPDVTVKGEKVGTTKITVTASDPDGESAEQSSNAIVTQPNRTPRVNLAIPDLELTVGDVVEIRLLETFTDPDGDQLTYTAESDNESVATATISSQMLTLTAVAAGTANISVTATDPDGLSATDEFVVTVEEAN